MSQLGLDAKAALERWYMGAPDASEVVMYAENLIKQNKVAEQCIEEVRSALAMVAPRSLTFRRIRDALNRYDEAK